MEEHLEGQDPTKAVFFVWTATFGIIMTIDNLSKRHILFADWYCTCKGCGKTLDHFLLHCLTTTDVWSFISMLLGLAWVVPTSVYEMLESWQRQFQSHRITIVWRDLPLCVMWPLWYRGNRQVFDCVERLAYVIKEQTLQSLFDSMLAVGNIPLMSFVDNIDFLSLWVVFFEKGLCTCYYVSFSFPFQIKFLLVKKYIKSQYLKIIF